MSLLFFDGFDSYVSADIGKRWTSLVTYASTPELYGDGRNGGNRLGMTASGTSGLQTPFAVLNFSSAATLIVGFFYSFINPGNSRHILRFVAGTSSAQQVALGVYADGRIYVSNASNTHIGISTTTVPEGSGTGVYIELKVTFSDAGAFELRVNGATEVSGISDFKNGAAPASADSLWLGNITTSSGCLSRFDDFYLCDALGTVNNDFLGDCRVDVIRPNGAGNYTQFTPSAGANWECVDDAAPNITDYVDSNTVGHRDSYAMENLTALDDPTIYAAQVLVAANKDNSGFRQIRPFVRSGGVDGDGAVATLGTSQNYAVHVCELNPNGDVAWTEATVNALEAGVAVAA